MIDHSAISTHSTSSRTRIGTLVLVTSSILRTLRVHDTLRLAIRWQTDERFLTSAHSLILYCSAQAVRSTRGWIARIDDSRLCFSTDRQTANVEGIPHVARLASASWNVINNRTLSLDPAYTWTRIFALVANTGLVGWTVWTENTLWLAAFVGISMVIVDADACTYVVTLLANCVWTARWRFAWIDGFFCNLRSKSSKIFSWILKSEDLIDSWFIYGDMNSLSNSMHWTKGFPV